MTYFGHPNDATAPFFRAAAVTPNDDDDLSTPSRALYVGTEGDVSVVPIGQDTPVLFVGIKGWLPGRVRRVMETGTTATDIVAVW